MATRAYVGKGTVWLQNRSSASNPRYQIGNCSKVTDSIELDKKEMPDYENAGGGQAHKFSRVKAMNTNFELYSLSPENMAIALRASVTANVTVTPIVGEAVTLPALGSLIPLARLGNLTVAPVFKKGATVIAAAGNWEWRRGGLYVLPGATGVSAGDASLTIDYTPLPDDLIQCLTAAADEFRVIVEGLNEADSGKAVIITKHRVIFDPTTGLDWIGDDYAKLTLGASQLPDTSISGAGISQYQTVRMAR